MMLPSVLDVFRTLDRDTLARGIEQLERRQVERPERRSYFCRSYLYGATDWIYWEASTLMTAKLAVDNVAGLGLGGSTVGFTTKRRAFQAAQRLGFDVVRVPLRVRINPKSLHLQIVHVSPAAVVDRQAPYWLDAPRWCR